MDELDGSARSFDKNKLTLMTSPAPGSPDPILWEGVERLIATAKKLAGISVEDEWRLRWVARQVMDAHAGQFRIDGKTPFFTHPLQATMKALEFGITDVTALQVALSHDSREDSPEYYAKVMKPVFQTIIDSMESEPEKVREELKYSRFRLGVRMLTMEEDDKVGQSYWSLPPGERRRQLELDYYNRLVNPHKYYHKETSGLHAFSPYDSAFIRDIQRIKLADRAVNFADLLGPFVTDPHPPDRVLRLPERLFS